MFNRKSSYALNKKDPNAIVYKKALQLLALAAQQKDYEQRKVG